MGGIATAIKNDEFIHALKVKEGETDNEFLITRHGQFVAPINILNIYGQQEGTSNKDDIYRRWESIMTEVTRIEAKGEWLIMLGDFNSHVGDIIDGNHTVVSTGGQLILNFLQIGGTYY